MFCPSLNQRKVITDVPRGKKLDFKNQASKICFDIVSAMHDTSNIDFIPIMPIPQGCKHDMQSYV